MKRYRRQLIAGIVIIVAIYILLLLFLDSQGQLAETDGIVDLLQTFPIHLFILGILLQSVIILLRFAEWHYYLGVIGARQSISVLDSAIIHIACSTMVVSPGKAAEVVKSLFLKSKTGIPVARSIPIVIAERVVDGIAVIVLMALTLLVGGDYLQLGEYDGISRAIIYSSTALVIAGLIVVQIAPLAYAILNTIQRIPGIRRLYDPLVEFYESSRIVFQLRHVIPMMLIGVLIYLCSTLGFYLVLHGFGLPLTWTLFFQTMFMVGVASAIGALSFVPNAAGVSEISNVAMLLAIVAPVYPAVTPALAAAAALLQGFLHKWYRVLVGLVIGWIFRRRLFSDSFRVEMDTYSQETRPATSSANSS